MDAVSSSFSLPIIGRRAKELSTSSTGVDDDDDGGIIYACSSQQRRRQYIREENPKNQFSSVLFLQSESVDARAYVSATSFASKKKNVSLIRALELISLSLCVSLCCAVLSASSSAESKMVLVFVLQIPTP